MRLTRLFIFLALLAVAVAGVLAITRFRHSSPDTPPAGEWTGKGGDIEIKLPAQPITLAPLVADVRRHPVQCTPRLKPLPIAQDLGNVNGLDEALMKGWSSARKKKLAANGFLIGSSTYNDFYDFYTANPTPFVTADSVFHVYHVILADTLVHLERIETIPRLRTLCVRAHANMRSLYDAAPTESRPGLRGALLYWTVAVLLCDAGATPHADVASEAQAEAQCIMAAAAAGEFLGAKRDYTVFKPVAGYETGVERAAHFRLNRYLTLTPLGYDSDDAARTALLAAAAAFTDAEAWQAYARLAQVSRFLAGEPEDPSPIEALDAARRLFGPALRLAGLGDGGKLAAWRTELGKAFAPRVADQPQTRPGAEPTRGIRFLCPGVSVRALAFQAVAAQALLPRGEHVLHVLGNSAAGVPANEQALLIPAAQDFAARRQRFYDGLDLHAATLHVLAHLDGPWADGYPDFMRNEAWQFKEANCQLGAWSEVEHDMFLNAKDNAMYGCKVGYEDRFHGYVEPVPAYFADLASLVRQTLDACEALDLFQRIKPDKDKPEYRSGELSLPRDGIVPTRKHYETLEELLLTLKRMAEKELEEQDFDADEIKLLKRFGGTLKYLSFDESNKPDAAEPMSVIVRLVREYQQQQGGYTGVGRPLWIGVIVPWKGKLHWATGATYSYYQFQRPLAEPLDDAAWKKETLTELPCQREKPRLFGRGVGIDVDVWDAAQFARWLPAEGPYFGGWSSNESWGNELESDLGSLGFITLDEGARAKAAEAFAGMAVRKETRVTLFLWLRTAPAPLRQQTALQALRTIRKRADTQKVQLNTVDYSLWCFLSFCLLEGTPGWREAEAADVPMEGLRATFREQKAPADAAWSKLGEFLAK